jgi:hypothetical protein
MPQMLLNDRQRHAAWIIHEAQVWRRQCTRVHFASSAAIARSRPSFQPPSENPWARTGFPARLVNRSAASASTRSDSRVTCDLANGSIYLRTGTADSCI